MKYLFWTLGLFSINSIYGQQGITLPIGKTYKDTVEAFYNQITYKTAYLLIRGNYKAGIAYRSGSGFIINNSYVATCYHVYYEQGFEPLEVKVIYNYRTLNNMAFYDSVYATLDYEPTKNQYNFKKHKFDTLNNNTDFIVLKLLNKIKHLPSKLDTSITKIKAEVYMVKATHSFYNKKWDVDISGGNAALRLIDKKLNEVTQTLAFSYAADGFSGSPIYNSSGHITGMHFGSIHPEDIPDYLLQLEHEGYSKSQTNYIREGHKAMPDYSIGLSVDIKYLIKTYLLGYL